MTSAAKSTRWARLLHASTALSPGLVCLTLAFAASAQTYTGNDVTSGPFASGTQIFWDSSKLNASAANAVSGGTQYFLNTGALNASAENAVSGGTQQFQNNSVLNASATDAVSGGTQYFFNTSKLNASAANAVSGGTRQFQNNSVLNASATDAVSGGSQVFFDTGALNASAENAVSGGTQQFQDNSVLNASATDAVSGGAQIFYHTSALQASVANAVSGGEQYFADTSTLNASATDAVSGGSQYFFDTGALNASAENAVSGGDQYFAGTSTLNASATDAVSGGAQIFLDTSALQASVANAVSGGEQYFAGTSTLNASAANAVSGGDQFFYDSSALNASAANAVSGGQINLFDNASVLVQATDALTNGASIAFNSGGAVVLNGYSTTVGQISGTGGVIRNTGATDAILTVDTTQFGDFTFSGTIEDGGVGALGLTKAGAGILTLTGVNTYTGETRIDGGRLVVNGSLLGSALTIGSGAVLGGSGTVGTTVIANGGRVSPGNSIGTLNVVGDFTFNAGSIYDVEVDPTVGTSDLIAVSGTAFLNGSVLHIGFNGAYQPTSTYTILTAGVGISGTFTGVASNFAFLDATLAYGLNDVSLTLARNNTDFGAIGATRNQRATGAGAESLGWGHALYDTIIGLDARGARTAFDALSGEIHASAKTALIEDSRFVRDAASGRMRAAFDGVGASSGATTTYGRALTGWGQIFGAWGRTDSDGNAAELQRQTQGVLLGADALAGDNWRLGALTGYSRSDFHDDRAASGTSDTTHLGLYGGGQFGAFGLRAGGAYSWHDIETKRFVSFPGFSDTLEADYNGGSAQAFGELGYRIDGPVAFEPFANLAYVNLHTDRFGEAGGDAALSVRSANTDVFFSTFGLRAASHFMLDGVKATARGALGWRHAYGDTTPISTQALAGGTDFAIAGAPIAQDAALIEAGLDLLGAHDATLSLSYSGQIASDAQDHGFTLGLSVPF